MSFITTFLTIVISLIAALMILGPIVILFKGRLPRFTPMNQISIESLPKQVNEFFSSIGNKLINDGFTPIAFFQQPSQVPNITTYYSLLINDNSKDRVLLTEIISQNSFPNIRRQFIEFCTEFSDGTEVSTSNIGEPGPLKYRLNKIVNRIPNVNDPHLLYNVHKTILKQLSKNTDKLLPERGREEFYISNSINRGLNAQVENGYMYFDSKADVFRFTLKGAYLTLWRNIWPISSIIRMQINKKGKELLNSLE